MKENDWNVKNIVSLAAKGGVIGVANIIPGVSGGTMAVVLGLYERLIEAIGNLATDKTRRAEYVSFLGIVGVGAVVAIGLLSFPMDYLLTDYPSYTYLFFIGLILGSVPAIYNSYEDMAPTGGAIASFIAGAALILSFALLFPDVEKSKDINFEYSLTAAGVALLVLSGLLAGGSMIVPGISGSFMLVLLGQYRVIIKAIKELNVVVLGIVAVGAGLGVWGFAKVIDVCMKKFPKETMYFILGLVIASMYPIFPGLPEGAGPTALAIGLAIAAFGLSIYMGKK